MENYSEKSENLSRKSINFKKNIISVPRKQITKGFHQKICRETHTKKHSQGQIPKNVTGKSDLSVARNFLWLYYNKEKATRQFQFY